MSVIVKDMKMPTTCTMCWLNTFCGAWNTEPVKHKGFNERLENCPLTELIRCKECKHRPHKNKDGYVMPPRVQVGVYAWGEPEYDDDESCPYVCEDRWYSRIPSDEQYCDRAEPKE